MYYYILIAIGIILSIWSLTVAYSGTKTALKVKALEEVVEHLYEGKTINVGVHHEKGPSN